VTREERVADDVPDEGWTTDEEPDSEAASVPHDDIMKRLLDYQRTLREGASPEEAAEAVRVEAPPTEAPLEPAPEVSEEPAIEADISEAVAAAPPAAEPAVEEHPEEEPETGGSLDRHEPELTVAERSPGDTVAEGGPKAGLEARIARLEGKLEDLGSRVGELRQSFQDMAIAADERLAAMEQEIGEAQRDLDAE
jgi:hypothetical protein